MSYTLVASHIQRRTFRYNLRLPYTAIYDLGVHCSPLKAGTPVRIRLGVPAGTMTYAQGVLDRAMGTKKIRKSNRSSIVLEPYRERLAAEIMAGHLSHKVIDSCARMPSRRRVLSKVIYALRKELQKR